MTLTDLKHDVLEKILSQPTAPFREIHVRTLLSDLLKRGNVPHFFDSCGNIVVGVKSQSEYLRLIRKPTREPIRLFMAHMDHPGFHGAKWNSETDLFIKWHGGSPTQHLEGAKVWISSRNRMIVSGIMTQVRMHSSGKSIDEAVVRIAKPISENDSQASAQTLFGGFQFRAPYWKEGELIYTQAADDLVGCFAIVSVALDLWKGAKKGKSTTTRNSRENFLGLLTRAEEVGFIGAIGHFRLNWFQKAKRPMVCVSLETSRTLPGAEIGKGPVVRLGDRFTVFDAGALQVFKETARKVLPDFHQVRLMDGGTCEASAATVFGIPSIGISVPLGNYHNQSLEGGPDASPPQGPAPEFVHLQDVQGLIHLCHGLLKPRLPWDRPWKSKGRDFQRSFRDYRSLL